MIRACFKDIVEPVLKATYFLFSLNTDFIGYFSTAMAQIFHPSTNTFSKVSIFGAVFLLAALIWIAALLVRSPYVTQVGVARSQPVLFSHEHHVSGLGIECRYCHTSVEVSSFAGIPPTKTCMTCHSQIWTDSPMLASVIDSFRDNQPLQWNRVYNLPDFVYFDHSIHVARGVACVSCHGRVDSMPLVWQQTTLHMEWCLECHREPERFIRPVEYVFQGDWQPPEDQMVMGRRLVEEYGINVAQITDCSTCHQ